MKFVFNSNINQLNNNYEKYFSFFISAFIFSQNSIAQKKHFPNQLHNHIHKHNNFAGGFFAGLVFSEFFGLNSRGYRQMYFKYKPIQQNWRLTRILIKGFWLLF